MPRSVDGIPIIHLAPGEKPPHAIRTLKMDDANSAWLHTRRKEKNRARPGSPQEKKLVAELVQRLVQAEQLPFPPPRVRVQAPDTMGVYLIRNPDGVICHVGSTHHAGLRRRLTNHLQNASSFSITYLKRRGHLLRNGWTYGYLEVPDKRLRPIVEHLAVGQLCPLHIGTHDRKGS